MTIKKTLGLIMMGVAVIGVMVLSYKGDNGAPKNTPPETNNVSVVDGRQIITINAKGGYSPKVTIAKAGLPTIIKVITNATFDCSSALTIPSIGYRLNLPPTGETIIDVPRQKAGTSMRGLCGMGMYNFVINYN